MTIALTRTISLTLASVFCLIQANALLADDVPRVGPAPVYLWEGAAPHAKGEAEQDRPSLTIYLPDKEKANGTAIVVCPGGGYGMLAFDHEGSQVARWLNKRGIAGFVLRYRHAPNYGHPVPLQDIQRAIRFVRHHAEQYAVAADRVGIMGFSAGGHLVTSSATHFDTGNPEAEDVVDRQSCRPSFLVAGYPVVTMSDPHTHKGSRKNLLGEKPSQELIDNLSNEKMVTPETPPTFLFHTNADTAVQAENSLNFFLALRKAGVPAELHIYQNGPHGVGLASGDPTLKSWTARLEDWLRVNGLLTKQPRVKIEGTINLGDKPIVWGWVSLIPLDGNGAPAAAAMIRKGKFSISETLGPCPGLHRVEVRVMADAWVPYPTIEDVQRIDDGNLTFEVPASNATLDLNLAAP